MKSKSVLIVEDNDLNRMLFENLIGQLFSFESAKNGLEAVEMAEKREFDLILMDIQMPKMDGITAMKKIRQGSNPDCPILAVTAYAEDSDKINFLEQGFDDFVTKPIRPREFLLLVQSHLKGNAKKSPSTASEEVEKHILDRNILNQLLKYNSPAAIQKVLEDFLKECNETVQLMQKLKTKEVPKELVEKIHNLKGNSGTLGAQRIYQSSQKAEDYGKNEKASEFFEELKNLKNEIHHFRDFLNEETIFGT